MSDITVSGSTDPYTAQSYSVPSNDKNTLTIESYFKLLAAQLSCQDMTNPMDNSEMMAQMVQMAMVQSLSTMTSTMQASTQASTQTYAASLVGQEVTVAVTEENSFGQDVATGVKYGRIESVSFTSGDPTFKLEGDSKEYSLTHLLGVGQIDDPYEDEDEKEDEGGGEDAGEGSEEGTPGASMKESA